MEKRNEIESYLLFKLGKETFASNVCKVLNILEVPTITEVPQSPEYRAGVINLRATVLPVIDSCMKFGMEATIITSNTCVLVLEVNADKGSIKIGALVDAVEEVLEIKDSNIQPSPEIGTKYHSEFIQGMVQKRGAFYYDSKHGQGFFQS